MHSYSTFQPLPEWKLGSVLNHSPYYVKRNIITIAFTPERAADVPGKPWMLPETRAEVESLRQLPEQDI